MIKVEVKYYLTKQGQRNAVLLGLSGADEQSVLVDGVPVIVSSPLADIRPNGDVYIDFRHITDPYYSRSTEWTELGGVQRRTEIDVSTSVGYDHPAIKFYTPLRTAEQVVEVLETLHQEIAELESKAPQVFAQWQAEDEEKIKKGVEVQMEETKSLIGKRTLTTRDYFSEEFNAEIEAGNEKVLKRVEEDKARRVAADEAKKLEEAAAQVKVADAAREFEALKVSWIETHGSNYLKLALKEKYDCLALYAQERAALEFPGFKVVQPGSFKKCCCPSESALKESVALTEALKKPVRVVWHNNAEALLIRNYLGGRYDLMKVPTTVDSP